MNAKTCLSWNTSDTLKISPPLATLIVSITSRIGSLPCSAASSRTLFKSIPKDSSKFLIANGEVTFWIKFSKLFAASEALPAPFIATCNAAPKEATAGVPFIPNIDAPAVNDGNAWAISFNSNRPSLPDIAKIFIAVDKSSIGTFKLSATEKAVLEISTIAACSAVAVLPITVI